MPAARHRLTTGGEQLEVVPLSREQRILDEVRDDSLEEESEAARLPLHGLVAPVGPDRAAIEIVLDRQEHFGAVAVLADRQARSHLPTDSKSRPRGDRKREASLSIYVSGDVRGEIRQVTALRARVLLRP
jgi:hypothetical protein